MLPPNEPDSSSNDDASEISSSTTSIPTTTTSSLSAAEEPPPPAAMGMFAAVLDQLRAQLADEIRKREELEAQQRQLALHLYNVVDQQIRGVKAIKQLVQSVREEKEDRANELLAVVKRMKAAWEKNKSNRRCHKRSRCARKKRQ